MPALPQFLETPPNAVADDDDDAFQLPRLLFPSSFGAARRAAICGGDKIASIEARLRYAQMNQAMNNLQDQLRVCSKWCLNCAFDSLTRNRSNYIQYNSKRIRLEE